MNDQLTPRIPESASEAETIGGKQAEPLRHTSGRERRHRDRGTASDTDRWKDLRHRDVD